MHLVFFNQLLLQQMETMSIVAIQSAQETVHNLTGWLQNSESRQYLHGSKNTTQFKKY